MYDELVQILLYFVVLVFGFHYVLAYIFGKVMYIPGETLKPGEKSVGRIFLLSLGLIMVFWSGYSLLRNAGTDLFQ